MIRHTMLTAVLIVVLILAARGRAAVYHVDALLNAGSGGIGFEGYVDTTADTFTVTQVIDGAGWLPFWTLNTALVMPARDSADQPYDVPDLWNGTIDGTWGFDGPQLNTIPFNEGIAGSPWGNWTTGWGAARNSAGTLYTYFTQTSGLRNWPYTSGNDYWITQPGSPHRAVKVRRKRSPGFIVVIWMRARWS